MIYYIIYYHLKNTKRFCPHDFGARAPSTPTLRVSVSSLIRYEYENFQAPFNWVAQRQIGTCLTGRSPHAQAEAVKHGSCPFPCTQHLVNASVPHVAGFSNAGHGHGRGSGYGDNNLPMPRN